MVPVISKDEFEERLRKVLQTEYGVTPVDASDMQIYKSLSAVVVEILRARKRFTTFLWSSLWDAH